jgi:hypothetical protein
MMYLATGEKRYAWYKQLMYSGAFFTTPRGRKPGRRTYLMSGVGGAFVGDDGYASALLGTVPRKHLPYYTYFYDRFMGKESSAPPAKRFDPGRQGRIWCLLFYPNDADTKDPTGVFPPAIRGSHGMSYFRNRWKDANDVLCSFTADTQHQGMAIDGDILDFKSPQMFVIETAPVNGEWELVWSHEFDYEGLPNRSKSRGAGLLRLLIPVNRGLHKGMPAGEHGLHEPMAGRARSGGLAAASPGDHA